MTPAHSMASLLADEVVVATVAATSVATEPVVTTRLSVGDAVELAAAGGCRTAQAAAARTTTGVVVVVVTWLIDSGAPAAQHRHQLLQLTRESLVVVDVVVYDLFIRHLFI